MPLKSRTLEPTAAAVWDRRGDILAAGYALMCDKPDRSEWDRQDHRLWRYAMAISRRLEKLH